MSADSDKKMISTSGIDGLSLGFTQDYRAFLTLLKEKIRSARLQAALAINKEVIDLYWHMGNQIIEKQNWGSKPIETLSHDLQNAFPETSGFSVRNLHRMRQFAARFPDLTIMPQAVAQLPWGHISLLIHKIKGNYSPLLTTACLTGVSSYFGSSVNDQVWCQICPSVDA